MSWWLEFREDLRPSELVVLMRVLTPAMRGIAKRKLAGRSWLNRPAPGRRSVLTEYRMAGLEPHSAHRVPGRVQEVIASVLGISRKTLVKAERVVAAAEAEPERWGDVLKEMDRSRNVNRAWRDVVESRCASKRRSRRDW
jgi:hypothetical protein